MKGRFTILLMSLLALALVLSLVAMLAPGAGAQDGGTAPDGPAKWMRHNVPAAQGSEAAAAANAYSISLKVCCICISPGPIPTSDSVLGSETPTSSTPYSSPSRWFCTDYCRK